MLIHNVALLASLAALVAGFWQDWGTWLTVKRMLISYLAFFCGCFLILAVRALPVLEGNTKIPTASQTPERRPDD
jgi:uncharacterized membrane protein